MAALRVLLAGGGSAGHTSPLIATADALLRLEPDSEIVCLGTARGLETRVIPEAGYRLELIPPVPLPRRPSLDLLRVPSRLLGAVRSTAAIFADVRPDVVVGFGGYVSVPAYLVARRRRVPLVIHEGNALPGLANRLGARLCTNDVAVSFPATRLPHAVFTGLPLRRAITTLDRAALKSEALAAFGLLPGLPTLLVTGGSQGAARINEGVSGAARAFADRGVQVLHVAGPKGVVDLPPDRDPDAPPYVVVPYVDRMDLAYSVADATVGRAGANTVMEAAVLGIPAVFVPLPIGNGEQRRNAAPVVEAGGGVLVPNEEFTPQYVAANVAPLLTDEKRLAEMASAGPNLMPRDADELLARMVLEAGRR